MYVGQSFHLNKGAGINAQNGKTLVGCGDHQLGVLAVSHAADEIGGFPLANLGKDIGKSL